MRQKLDLDNPQFKQKLVRTMIQNTPVAYMLIDKSWRVQFVNDHFLRLRKLKKEDTLGKICYDISNGGVPCASCVVKDAAAAGRGAKILRKDIMPDGAAIYVEDFAIPIKCEIRDDLILEIMVDRTFEMQLKEKLNFLFLEVVQNMIRILEIKDPYTCLHSRDVSAISAKLTWYLGLGDRAVFNATLGGLLHDLGKLYVPDNVLNKPGKLDDKEYAILKEHPMFTYLALPDLESFGAIKEIAISHHERWDGTGYPNGLKGEEIPIEARIAAIADTYSAMTSDRPYRKGLPHEVAIAEIKKYSGTQFDPDIVEKFIQMVDEFLLDTTSLTCQDESSTLIQNLNLNQYIQRKLEHAPDTDEHFVKPDITDNEVDDLATSDSFMHAIFDNTPANYMVIDESFNILFVSERYALAMGKSIEELTSEKCFDATDKKMYCFQVENGAIRCPAVRAFYSGKGEHALLEETILNQTFYHSVYSLPMEIEDHNGEKIKCFLEILSDVTKEKIVQLNFENDLKQIIDVVYNLISELNLDVTGNVAEISAEANNFGDYLEKLQGELSKIISAHQNV